MEEHPTLEVFVELGRIDQEFPSGHGSGEGIPRRQVVVAKEMAALISAILEREVSPDQNVFEAGAQSLDLARLVAAIYREYRVRLRAVEIFDYPDAVGLAELVLRRGGPPTSGG